MKLHRRIKHLAESDRYECCWRSAIAHKFYIP